MYSPTGKRSGPRCPGRRVSIVVLMTLDVGRYARDPSFEKLERQMDDLRLTDQEKVMYRGYRGRASKSLEEMRSKLKEDPGGDWAKVAEMAAAEQALSKRVDVMMSEWAKLSEEAE